MTVQENVPLAPYTAFKVGGEAERLLVLKEASLISKAFEQKLITDPIWTVGYGTNCLISDAGLPGTVILLRDGPKPVVEKDIVVADAATKWDEMVRVSVENGLWGLELMSEIPGNVGAALMGNIAAYGQQVSDSFAWTEVFDPKTRQIKKLGQSDIEFSYRATSLQQQDYIVLRVALKLSSTQRHQLKYKTALAVADELGLRPDSLKSCREIIVETRRRGGSIYDEADPTQERTAGSFFKNPVVDKATAEKVARFDETGRSLEEVLEQNRIHGGDEYRVSSAHVLLAAGFKRGQTWGDVRLHLKHVLKIENVGGASAQNIYDVAQEIMSAVRDKLGIELEPEVRSLGKFD